MTYEELQLNKNLYRADIAGDNSGDNLSSVPVENASTGSETQTDSISSGELAGEIILTGGFLQSKNYVENTTGWKLTPTSGDFNFGITVDSIDIPDTATANSFHVDSDGNTWWGATTLEAAPAKVLNTGAATFTSVVILDNVQATGTFVITGGGAFLTTQFTAGENISALDLVIISGGNIQIVDSDTGSTATQHAVTTTTWKSQMFTTASDSINIPYVDLTIEETLGSGQITFTLSIRADSGGQPTGADLQSQTVAVTLQSDAGMVEKRFTFTTAITVSASTDYHLILRSDAGAGGGNWRGGNTGSTGANTSANSGSTWSANNGPLWNETFDVNRISGRIFQADASVDDERANNIIGIADAAITSGSDGNVTVIGIKSGFTELTAGVTYYASDTSGQISSSAGTQSRKIGRALSTTQLLIIPQLQ